MLQLILSLLAATALLFGASPATWELSQYSDFIKGKLRGFSLTREGSLVAGPQVESVLDSGEAALWSVAAAPGGGVYLGTGGKGRIFRVLPNASQPELFAQLDAPHVFALALDTDGSLVAAASPGGKIYRISSPPQGKALVTLIADTGAKYIWSLLVAPNGVLYAGSGDEGRVYRIEKSKAEIYYETGQSNITALALAADGALLAGSDPNGMVYRIQSKGNASVLHDAAYTEIRSILPGPKGEIFLLAMGGTANRRSQNANSAQPQASPGGLPQVTTSITVTEEAQAGLDLKPKQPSPQPATSFNAAAVPTVSSSLEIPGLDKAAILRLNPDLSVDPLLVTKEENIFDLWLEGGKLHFSTDGHGRIYRLDGERKATLLIETGESEISRVASTATGWLAASTNSGRLLRIPRAPRGQGEYESPVHDAGSVGRWGSLNITQTLSGGAQLVFETRSGNSARPDATWSPWVALSEGRVQSPNARFLQWHARSTLPRQTPAAALELRAVTLNYLPQNQPPLVKSITAAVSLVLSSNAKSTPAANAQSSVYSLTVTDTGEASASSAGTASLLPTRPAARQLILSWLAEDPDSDQLLYTLSFRGEEESNWKLLKDNLSDAAYAIDGDALADGRYLFRVSVSDRASNTLATAKEADLVSAPVQLDQTPPMLTLDPQGNQLILRATDRISSIRRMEYSVNAGTWVGLEAEDGLLDTRNESARIDLSGLRPGENLVTARVYDAALNVALIKTLITR
jgi:hypothetical protein